MKASVSERETSAERLVKEYLKPRAEELVNQDGKCTETKNKKLDSEFGCWSARRNRQWEIVILSLSLRLGNLQSPEAERHTPAESMTKFSASSISHAS